MIRTSLALAVLLALAGCATTSTSSTRGALVGRWDMDRITDRGADVTAEHNPAGDRYIVLRADGTFESGGQPYGRNTGRWIYDPARRELGLDSDAGPDDDSIWTVTLRGDTMEWGGAGSEYARRFRIVSRRAR